jgi:hypothetical protein
MGDLDIGINQDMIRGILGGLGGNHTNLPDQTRVLGGPDEFGLPSGTYRSPSYTNCLNTCRIIDESDPSPRLKIKDYRTPSFQSCIDTCTYKNKNSSEGFTNHYDKSFSSRTILLYVFMILLIYFIVTSSLKDNIVLYKQ